MEERKEQVLAYGARSKGQVEKKEHASNVTAQSARITAPDHAFLSQSSSSQAQECETGSQIRNGTAQLFNQHLRR